MKLNKIILSFVALCIAVPACAQGGGRESTEVTVKGTKLSITYGSPALKGRDVFTIAPVGMVWRLGRNEATEIETTGDIIVAGTTLKAGRYSLWAKKTGANAWNLAFHPKTHIWGVPELKEGYVAELPLKVEKVDDSAEQLNIALAEKGGKAWVKIHWGTALLSGAIDVK